MQVVLLARRIHQLSSTFAAQPRPLSSRKCSWAVLYFPITSPSLNKASHWLRSAIHQPRQHYWTPQVKHRCFEGMHSWESSHGTLPWVYLYVRRCCHQGRLLTARSLGRAALEDIFIAAGLLVPSPSNKQYPTLSVSTFILYDRSPSTNITAEAQGPSLSIYLNGFLRRRRSPDRLEETSSLRTRVGEGRTR